ncbi:hypothetical protein [Tropicimonas marinistellae]|uniref:hypothetical protein n=1 Tax=Tropicimonas marinistellae TaxID=1739787 RepID=UPI00083555A7|nr:hypothetical protein [Tropicimonas marinistellae]
MRPIGILAGRAGSHGRLTGPAVAPRHRYRQERSMMLAARLPETKTDAGSEAAPAVDPLIDGNAVPGV